MNTRNSSWTASRSGFELLTNSQASTPIRAVANTLAALLIAVPLVARSADPDSATKQAEVKLAEVPEGATLICVSLAASDNGGPRPQGYLSQRSPEPLTETSALPNAITETYAGKEFSAFEIATLFDGTRYIVVLNEDKSLKFLNRNESSLWYARIYRVAPQDGSKPEIVREGFQSGGNDVTFPVELQLPGIGSTKLKKLRTELGYSVSGYQNGKPQVYSGRGAGLHVSGSEVSKEGKLTVTVTVPDEMKVTRETQVSLRFEPTMPGLPERTATGKVTDFLTLSSAKFVVKALERDFSRITLAVVAGSLQETLKEQLQLGTKMPLFSQVDLITRKVVTRDDLLTSAKRSAPIFFVFGDLASGASRNPYGPPPGAAGGSTLPLPTSEVAEQLGLEMQPKPLVIFVTRQIGLDFLYGDLRNKTPDYRVLSDFADPLRTTFRSPQLGPGGWYGASYPNSTTREPSLRQLFNLPERALSLVAFDATGNVVYVKADAAAEFLPSLAEARKAVKK
jgi:hypothetical protein